MSAVLAVGFAFGLMVLALPAWILMTGIGQVYHYPDLQVWAVTVLQIAGVEEELWQCFQGDWLVTSHGDRR